MKGFYVIILISVFSCNAPSTKKNKNVAVVEEKAPKVENSILGRWRLDSVAENGVIKNFPPNEEYDCSGIEFTEDQVIGLKQKDRIESGKPISKYERVDDSLFYKTSHEKTFLSFRIIFSSKSVISLNGYYDKSKQTKTTLYLSKVIRRKMLCE